ncbi:uncharacterized protein M6B38_205435 [Iris pallida]|uniref:Uncharacterized protein n=1 Tax=Iris pallida TaxID=29817 RepID=A0AAX6E7G0_IRIPA|nr:uncharacterized protein M6B38_205435 [Iris pallida]
MKVVGLGEGRGRTSSTCRLFMLIWVEDTLSFWPRQRAGRLRGRRVCDLQWHGIHSLVTTRASRLRLLILCI